MARPNSVCLITTDVNNKTNKSGTRSRNVKPVLSAGKRVRASHDWPAFVDPVG